MPLPRLLALLLTAAATLALTASPALADLDIQYRTTVKGKDQPALIVHAQRALRGITITLTDDKGASQQLRVPALRVGQDRRVPFRHALGKATYEAQMEVRWADGETGLYRLDFDAVRVVDLEIRVAEEDVDLDARRVRFLATNPLTSAALDIYGEDGQLLDELRLDFDPPSDPAEPVVLTWSELEADIGHLNLRVTDIAGFYTGVRISPFYIEIPHDNVEFETGRADIRRTEEPKLRATLGHLRKAIEAHGSLAGLKLYIAGYTDTVGSRESNRELSTRRARSIAAWFRANGVRVPIYYQGFGQDVLAVPTPDETAEPRNRRALYILSSQVPTGESVPSPNWRRL